MSVAKITEISASSPKGVDEAIHLGLDRAMKTLKNVKSAWVKDQTIIVSNDKIKEYRVLLKVTFLLND